MLNPSVRSLYTSALTPPPGMVFDETLATTFSMDPALLLETPVYLALMAADGQGDPDPLSVLEAMRRYAKAISVYVQKGRIQVPRVAKPNPLFGYLEGMVIEVRAPKGGVFHPKVWAIRFVDPDGRGAMYRLVVLTRNMTTDPSWDLSLQLEGVIGRRKAVQNKPLAHFFKTLPELATGAMDKARQAQAHRFSEELHRVAWELPEGFDELAFYLPGTKGYEWRPPAANRMAVISPFCADEALRSLVKETKAPVALISRPETLSGLHKETLALFSQCLHLDEAAETEDGEALNPADHPRATGLHAKAYLFETRHYTDFTHLVMGSANATNAAFQASNNIEILVGLVGRRSKVGGIDALLGDDGLGEYLVTFDCAGDSEGDSEKQEAEKCVEAARRSISEAELSITCAAALKDNLWALTLSGRIPPLDGIVSAALWPITVLSDLAVNLPAGEVDGGIALGAFSASSVTGLIAFALTTRHPEVSARFVLNLPVTGLPDERNAAILQTMIRNQEGFIRYLLLLLGNDAAGALFGAGSGTGPARWLLRMAEGEDVPLLEELTRAFSRYPERLSEISGLVRELSRDTRNAVVPERFLKLWSVFESAVGGV